MDERTEVRTALPELEEIDDETLRERVVAVWATGLADSDYDSLDEMPWWPPLERRLDDPVGTVSHISAVVRIAVGFADVLAEVFDANLDRDVVAAGALVHDISKFYELTGADTNEFNEWIPHPHYAVHVLAAAGFSEHVQHVALAHSDASNVEPRSLEAKIVATADRYAVDGLFVARTGELPE